MRTRRYVAKHWFTLLGPVLRYSYSRDAYVLRVERRQRRERPSDGVERRGVRSPSIVL